MANSFSDELANWNDILIFLICLGLGYTCARIGADYMQNYSILHFFSIETSRPYGLHCDSMETKQMKTDKKKVFRGNEMQ